MADTSTTGELYKAKAILDDEVNVAVDAYLATPDLKRFSIAKGYRLDVAAAVENSFARHVLETPSATEERKRIAVRTAILLARPSKNRT